MTIWIRQSGASRASTIKGAHLAQFVILMLSLAQSSCSKPSMERLIPTFDLVQLQHYVELNLWKGKEEEKEAIYNRIMELTQGRMEDNLNYLTKDFWNDYFSWPVSVFPIIVHCVFFVLLSIFVDCVYRFTTFDVFFRRRRKKMTKRRRSSSLCLSSWKRRRRNFPSSSSSPQQQPSAATQYVFF